MLRLLHSIKHHPLSMDNHLNTTALLQGPHHNDLLTSNPLAKLNDLPLHTNRPHRLTRLLRASSKQSKFHRELSNVMLMDDANFCGSPLKYSSRSTGPTFCWMRSCYEMRDRGILQCRGCYGQHTCEVISVREGIPTRSIDGTFLKPNV